MASMIISFGGHGHLELSWKEHDEKYLLPKLQEMLDRKIKFFKVNKKVKLFKKRQTEVTDINQIKGGAKIVIPDKSLQELFEAGLLMTAESGEVETTGEFATTPEEIVKSDTIAVAAPGGG